MTNSSLQESIRQRVLDIVGALRAESLGDDVFRYFAEPSFFPKLQSRQSVILKGGRGTGKTTLLRCLSYQGQSALRGRTESPQSWPFFGLFWRINTNRVAAFDGPELSSARWKKLFAHYINLELTELLVDLLVWLEGNGFRVQIPMSALGEVSVALNVEASDSLAGLKAGIRLSRARFEARLNNIADSDADLGLSMLGAPVDLLISYIRADPEFEDKKLFFLIDEYENLLDYQQEIFNTLIKHSSNAYSFKVGVNELGFRRRSTINPHEILDSPADFNVLSIASELAPKFNAFAEELVASRLAHVAQMHDVPITSVRRMFPTLSPDDEAVRLGVVEKNRSFLQDQSSDLRGPARDHFEELSPLQQFFVASWTKATSVSPTEVVEGLYRRDASWVRRYGNYSVSLLYAIKAGKSGRRKYYAGWSTLCSLASTNTRYLLELVSGILQRHVEEGNSLAGSVSAEIQTDLACEIGLKNLQLLQRETDHAASLVRLVLGLGRVFQVLAANPVGHTPEVTQFALPPSDALGPPGDIERRVTVLMNEAVNALAIVRYQGTKLQRPDSVKSFDYALHPIFTPLFSYSYRRKRKIEISEEEFLAFVSEPRWAMTRVLLRQNRDPSDAPLPDQLRLFSTFYE
jgi:hypothetical protein